ncbi:PLC-like phosphodiesterase [Stachybotrys elegans]|uniref:PLC-like phosphodiesterase n=1 Tax=Stachybotrys elegans TaxID=80388 RepID=A0A8K0T2Y9_9HYPO|nr:PLC-like phosphodiesterase [Stachybotrys elegans]
MKASYALALLSAANAYAQVVSYSETDDLTFIQGTNTNELTRTRTVPTGLYTTYTTRITLGGGTSVSTHISTATITETDGPSTETLTSTIEESVSTSQASQTSTSTAARPTSTLPCNEHVELCSRKYSNFTMVGAHNSPFNRPGNSGSNQALSVGTQLDDGVRFLQAQIQWPENSDVPHFCHTSCDLLDAGPIQDWLGEVRDWLDNHPNEVVTILLGNGNYSDPALYHPYISESGILRYSYEPPFLPMTMDDWPTLEWMIAHGQRAVIFMDYGADQLRYPWLIDEFAHMWETPFDPIDRNFPCVIQRPPDLGANLARDRMYLMNHNLNAEFNVFDTQILVPAVSVLNETNAVSGYGSLGLAANNCRSDWGRAPNILNVDYYNYGNYPGSVFEVAAQHNNVTYERRKCCGMRASPAPPRPRLTKWVARAAAVVLTGLML